MLEGSADDLWLVCCGQRFQEEEMTHSMPGAGRGVCASVLAGTAKEVFLKEAGCT